MEKTNIQRFDEVAAQILSALYELFPQPTHIDPKVIGVLYEEPDRDEAGGVLYSDEWNELDIFANHTAKWLAEEGYLSERSGRFYPKYTLSAVGLKSLKHVEKPELGAETLGDRLKKASSEGARATTSKLVDQFLVIGGPLLARAIGVS